MSKACIDTGPLNLYYAKDPPREVQDLIDSIKKRKIKAYILWPVLIEVFKHLCIAHGKDKAEVSITSLISKYPVELVSLDESLIIKAGLLKCQHRSILSYIDCMVIAYSLNKKMTLHTTEKSIPKIPNLKIKKYSF